MFFGIKRILHVFGVSFKDDTNKETDNDDFQMEIHRENLRQASMSFNQYRLMLRFSLFATFVNTLAVLLGASLFLFGQIPEGTLATYVSALSGTCFYKTSREAEERAKQAKKKLEKVMQENELED